MVAVRLDKVAVGSVTVARRTDLDAFGLEDDEKVGDATRTDVDKGATRLEMASNDWEKSVSVWKRSRSGRKCRRSSR